MIIKCVVLNVPLYSGAALVQEGCVKSSNPPFLMLGNDYVNDMVKRLNTKFQSGSSHLELYEELVWL